MVEILYYKICQVEANNRNCFLWTMKLPARNDTRGNTFHGLTINHSGEYGHGKEDKYNPKMHYTSRHASLPMQIDMALHVISMETLCRRIWNEVRKHCLS